MRMAAHRDISAFTTLLVFLCYFAVIAHEKQVVQFPGKISQTASPNGRYVLINIDSESETHALSLGGNHALYLRDLNTGEEKKIYSYDRHVEVLWSPKGGRLVINDYGGSNYANCIIFIFDPAWDIIDIEQLVRHNLYSNKSIFTNEHVYIVGIEWTREDVVKIKFYGYGSVNPEGFTLWYKYYITGQLKRLSMHP